MIIPCSRKRTSWNSASQNTRRLLSDENSFAVRMSTNCLTESSDVDSVRQLVDILTAKLFSSESSRLVFWEALFQDVRFLEQGMIIVPETLIHAVFSQTETLESSIVKSVVRSRLLVTIDRLFRLSKTHPDWMQLEQLTVRFDNHHEADAWFSSFLSEGSSTKQTEQEGFPDAGSIAENPEFVAEA